MIRFFTDPTKKIRDLEQDHMEKLQELVDVLNDSRLRKASSELSSFLDSLKKGEFSGDEHMTGWMKGKRVKEIINFLQEDMEKEKRFCVKILTDEEKIRKKIDERRSKLLRGLDEKKLDPATIDLINKIIAHTLELELYISKFLAENPESNLIYTVNSILDFIEGFAPVKKIFSDDPVLAVTIGAAFLGISYDVYKKNKWLPLSAVGKSYKEKMHVLMGMFLKKYHPEIHKGSPIFEALMHYAAEGKFPETIFGHILGEASHIAEGFRLWVAADKIKIE